MRWVGSFGSCLRGDMKVKKDGPKRGSGVEITQTSRRNRAKNLQNNFPEFRRSARTKSARIRPTCVAQTAEHRWISSPSRKCVVHAKRPSDARGHANLPQKSRKIPRILARRGQRSCLKSASIRCVIQNNVTSALIRVENASKCEKVRHWHRCHANFPPKSREKN